MQKNNIDYALLKKAQGGHQESLCALTERAREELLAYLARLTLDIHVAEDLCQETIVQMLKSLPRLELASEKAFWAWLYKTAFSRVSRHFRSQGNTRLHLRTLVDNNLVSRIPTLGPSGPEVLMRKERTTAVAEAMNAIKLRYRNILALRCFQDLSYAEIALTTGGTELQARLLFFRAKRSLRHQLACRGFKAKEHLLPALSLFAALTAGRSKAASAATGIKAASLHVSTATTALGMATTKAGVAAIVAVACVVAGTAGRVAMTSAGDAPQAVIEPAKNLDTTLLDRLQSSDFLRPSAIGKIPVPVGQKNILDGTGFSWVDRATQKPAQGGADLRELLLDKPQLDRRAVILAADHRIDVQFQQPIVDGPGADIIIAGWSGPGPMIEVFDGRGRGMPLPNPTQLKDTWDRVIWGYDLAQLPRPTALPTVRITGIHNQGPHQGFELNEIRARMVRSEAQSRF